MIGLLKQLSEAAPELCGEKIDVLIGTHICSSEDYAPGDHQQRQIGRS